MSCSSGATWSAGPTEPPRNSPPRRSPAHSSRACLPKSPQSTLKNREARAVPTATPAVTPPLDQPESRSRDERKTDQNTDQESGAARRGQPGRRIVLAPTVHHSGGGNRAGARRRRSRPAGPRPLGHGGSQAPPASPAQGLLGQARP